MVSKEKLVHPVPRVSSPRETENFNDPMVPLGHGKWGRASEQPLEVLTQVVELLEKKLNEGYVEYNQKVLAGARNQLAKK